MALIYSIGLSDISLIATSIIVVLLEGSLLFEISFQDRENRDKVTDPEKVVETEVSGTKVSGTNP